MVKNLPANAGDMRDIVSVSNLGRSLGGGHGTRSSILAWKITWTDWWLQSMGSPRVEHD